MGAYEKLRESEHPRCLVCGPTVENGFQLQFHKVDQNRVEATFACQPAQEGYPDVLHGGVICTLLDGAMTNCLFALGDAAVTADMHVRFRKPVAASGTATVRAWMVGGASPLYNLAAELEQEGEIKATASARFVQRALASRIGEGLFAS